MLREGKSVGCCSRVKESAPIRLKKKASGVAGFGDRGYSTLFLQVKALSSPTKARANRASQFFVDVRLKQQAVPRKKNQSHQVKRKLTSGRNPTKSRENPTNLLQGGTRRNLERTQRNFLQDRTR
jgi:hypothetical protein